MVPCLWPLALSKILRQRPFSLLSGGFHMIRVNSRMRLVEDYRHDVAGLSTKEAKAVRAMWHAAAKRYLNFLMLTSDVVPAFPTRNRDGTIEDHTRPLARMFLKRSVEELVELYRATKPKRAVVKSPA